MLYFYGKIVKGNVDMKLFYSKRTKVPTYYAQQGIRNGKKQLPEMSRTLASILNS